MSFSGEAQDMVWKRSVNCSDLAEDVWDDRALIDAYDRAVKQVNRRLADKSRDTSRDPSGGDKSAAHNTHNALNAHDWQTGEYCRTTYTEDGIEYEAQIISIDTTDETCFVKYIGYGNEEHKSLNQLRPSLGKRCRRQQTEQSSVDSPEVSANFDTDYDTKSFANQMPVNREKHNPNKSQNRSSGSTTSSQPWFTTPTQPIIPPPITMRLPSGVPSDDESLASMLMSWYMSGYHTGYYTALKHTRQQSSPNKSNTDSLNK